MSLNKTSSKFSHRGYVSIFPLSLAKALSDWVVFIGALLSSVSITNGSILLRSEIYAGLSAKCWISSSTRILFVVRDVWQGVP